MPSSYFAGIALALFLPLGACTSPSAEGSGIGEEATEGRNQGDDIGRMIRIEITPGKPNSPTEIVAISRAVDGCTVTVERRHQANDGTRAAVVEDQQVTLDETTQHECDAVFEQADSADLLSFVAVEEDEIVDDGASYEVEISQGSGADSATNLLSWNGPITDEASVQNVIRAAAELAGRHVPEPELFYFPTG